MKINLAGLVRIPIGIVALILTYPTPLFWALLYLVVSNEINFWIKLRR